MEQLLEYKSSSETDEEQSDCELSQVVLKKKNSCSSSSWVRSFPHVEGNWPGHVYIKIPLTKGVSLKSQKLRQLVQHFIHESNESLELFQTDASGEDDTSFLHLSLSRPFVLLHHQIDHFVNELRSALKWRHSFSFVLKGSCFLSNDDKTRTFLAIPVTTNKAQVIRLIKCVDRCMIEFNLPVYYENPLPHVSIASFFGASLLNLIDESKFATALEKQKDEEILIDVLNVCINIGNKKFNVQLT